MGDGSIQRADVGVSGRNGLGLVDAPGDSCPSPIEHGRVCTGRVAGLNAEGARSM